MHIHFFCLQTHKSYFYCHDLFACRFQQKKTPPAALAKHPLSAQSSVPVALSVLCTDHCAHSAGGGYPDLTCRFSTCAGLVWAPHTILHFGTPRVRTQVLASDMPDGSPTPHFAPNERKFCSYEPHLLISTVKRRSHLLCWWSVPEPTRTSQSEQCR